MKINPTFALVVGLVAWQSHQASGGEITGTVTLKGTPPPERPITYLKEDPFCGKLVTEAPTTRFYVVGSKGELADTIVMLKGIPAGKSKGASAKPAVLDQKLCQYVPQIIAVQTGQKLLVKNSDPLMHNVNWRSTVSGNPSDNKPQAQGAADLSVTFPAAENFIKFQCDVHSSPVGSWMLAWVTVIDHPYFAVTDKDGAFKITDVPPGEYTVTALHRKAALTGVDQKVTVKDGEPAKVDFSLEVPK